MRLREEPTEREAAFAADGQVTVVAREGDPAAEVPGAVFADVGAAVNYGNASGTTAYAGSLEVGVGGVTAEDSYVLVIREPGGASHLNDAGQIVFAGSLTGGGVTPDDDYGFWRSDDAGGFELLLRIGDVAPGLRAS